MGHIEEQLFGAMEKVARQVIETNGADLTVNGEVIKVTNVEIGEYRVKYEGNTFLAYSESPTTVYQQGDDVYVLVPGANFNNKKIILGHAAYENSTTHTDMTEMTNKYIPLGPNWLSEQWYHPYYPEKGNEDNRLGICSVRDTSANSDRESLTGEANFSAYGFARDDKYISKDSHIWNPYSEDIKVLTPMTSDQLERVDQLLQSYSATADYLMIKADFQTEFINVHNQGEYYLVVEVLEEDPAYIDVHTEIARLEKEREKYFEDSEKYIEYTNRIEEYKKKLEELEPNRYELNEYRLGFGAFIGQPYNYPVSTPNTAYLKITPGAIRGLAAVYLTQDGYMQTDKKLSITEDGRPVYEDLQVERNNIFAKNIEIQFARKVNLLDNMYYSWIETPRGDTLYNKENGDTQTEVTLKARLFYGYKDILDDEDCNVYWMRERPDITRSEYERIDAELHNPKPLWTPENYPSAAEHPEGPPEITSKPGENASQYDIDSYNYTLAKQKYDEWELTADEFGKTFYDYTGPGWIPVEWLDEMNDRGYDINFDELTVPYEAVPIQWRYRAVIVYKGSVRTTDPIAIVYNDDTGFHFNIQQFNDSDIMKEYLRIRDLDYPQDSLKAEGNPESGDTPKYYAEEYGRWFLSLPDGSYREITSDGENGAIMNKPIEQKGNLINIGTGKDIVTILEGPKHITNYLINTLLDFNISVYLNDIEDVVNDPRYEYFKGNGVFADWPKTEPICNLTYQVITDQGLDLLVTWNGQDTFVYNSDGSLMVGDKNENHTITFTLKWLDGNGENYSWEIFGPERIALSNNADKTKSSEKSMMENMWSPDMSKEINFTIRDTYDQYKTENYFILKITSYSGQTWEIRKDITFLKNGGQGTNGSIWFAPIYPTNFQDGTEKNMVLFQEPIITQEKPIHLNRDENGVLSQSADYVLTNPNGVFLEGSRFNKLIIRPFITKLGQDISDLKEYYDEEVENSQGDLVLKHFEKSYFYEVFWDVRYPTNSLYEESPLKGNSWLRLYKISKKEKDISFDGEFTRTDLERIGIDYDNVEDDGLIGYYCSKPSKPGYLGETYGAVEVKFEKPFAREDKIPTIEECHYNFYVKATVNIYEDVKDMDDSGADPVESKLVTLTSYYPVDLLIKNPDSTSDDVLIDDYYLTCNWPKNIKYNVTGYQPQTFTEDLIFKYQKDDVSSGLIKPIALTPKLVKIDEHEETTMDDNGNVVKTGEISYSYRPRSYVFWGDNYHAALKGDILFTREYEDILLDEGDEYYQVLKNFANFMNKINTTQYNNDENYKKWVDDQYQTKIQELSIDLGEEKLASLLDPNGYPLSQKKTETISHYEYYRTVIYDLDIYGGNMAINGWDGTRIDINQDQGTIFAPTIGAGYKDPFKNTFTGVIMGIDTSQVKPNEDANYAQFPKDETDKNGYMTGLYGYQDGVISFGIMENGTAFFGRADRGGRIVIDGYNAQIYGGFAGEDIEGSRDMDMTNRMRLSFIDFEQIAQDSILENGDETVDNTDENEKKDDLGTHGGSISVDGFTINTGSFDVTDFYPYFAVNDAGNENNTAKWSGFGSGRGYSTPAIEIGSYRNYMEKDGQTITDRHGYQLIRELKITDFKTHNYYLDIKKLEIPGYRKFLVTYDGTLYAMNAFIKGNLVSSNIIGSQFFNSDGNFAVTENGNLCLGKNGEDWKQELVYIDKNRTSGIDYRDVWSKFIPVTYYQSISDRLDDIAKNDFWQGGGYNPDTGTGTKGGFNFFVSSEGTVICNDIHIAGGSLDIGNFHIIGEKIRDDEDKIIYDAGDVVSFGTMFLIGGKAEVFKNKNAVSEETAEENITEIALQGWGDVYFRGTLNNIGNVYLGSAKEKVARDDSGLVNPAPGTGVVDYMPSSLNSPFSLEIGDNDTKWDYFNGPVPPIEGAFWPLHFYVDKALLEGDTMYPRGNSWLNLPINIDSSLSGDRYTWDDQYMPPFGKRIDAKGEGQLFPGMGQGTENALFRVDSNGLWSDLIFFRRFNGKTGKYDAPIRDEDKMENPEVALGFLIGEADEATPTLGFGIRNISRDAPQMIFETVGDARISVGARLYEGEDKTVGDTPFGSDDLKGKSLYLEAKQDVERDKFASSIVIGGQARNPDGSGSLMGYSTISQNSGVIGLFTNESYGAPDSEDKLQALLILGGIGVAGSQIDEVTEEVIGLIPKHDAGQIWGRGRGITLESLSDSVELNNTDEEAGAVSIRLSRTKTGETSMSWNGTTLNEDGLLYIRAKNFLLDIEANNQYGIYARFG